jgi:hypothetical protein
LHCAIDRSTVRSIAYMGLRSNLLTCVQAQRPTSHTHTLSTNAIEHTLVRSIALVLNPHVSLSPLLPLVSHQRCIAPSLFLSLYHHSTSIPLLNHHHSTSIPPLHHHRAAVSPPSALLSPLFLHFSFLSHNPNFSLISHLPPFLKIKRHIPIHGLCPFVVYVGFLLFLQGVGLVLKWVFKPLFLEMPTKCSTNWPNHFQHA